VEQDEFPRFGATMEGMAKLKASIFRKTALLTAGKASAINDGAAIWLSMTADEAKKKRGVTPLARIASWATCGVILPLWAQAPFHEPQALERAGGSRRSRSDRSQ